MDIAALIGCITGSVSIIAVIYFVGVWRGQVDSDRKYFRERFDKLPCVTDYPPAEIHTMVKTLWEVYVLDALHKRPDLASRGSKFKLKPEGERLIPEEVKVELLKVAPELKNKEDIASGFLVVETLGIGSIEALSKRNKLSVQETIAILSTFLQDSTKQFEPE